MRYGVFVVLVTLASCVDRSFPEGLPCSGVDQRCPPDQMCVGVGAAARCYLAGNAPDASASGGSCNPFAQDCPNSGDACYAPPGGPMCAAAGTGQGHAPCSNNSNCAKGYTCQSDLLGMECVPYCRVSAPQCTGLDKCVALGGGGDLGTCQFTGCSVFEQKCGPGEGCFWDLTRHVGLCNHTPGQGTQGSTCAGPNDCGSGFECFMCPSAGMKCGSFCDPAGSGAECSGKACRMIDTGIGVCDPC